MLRCIMNAHKYIYTCLGFSVMNQVQIPWKCRFVWLSLTGRRPRIPTPLNLDTWEHKYYNFIDWIPNVERNNLESSWTAREVTIQDIFPAWVLVLLTTKQTWMYTIGGFPFWVTTLWIIPPLVWSPLVYHKDPSIILPPYLTTYFMRKKSAECILIIILIAMFN